MPRLNRAIELLEQGQPVYYTSTAELTYYNGRELCGTWADYIRLDLEHGPFDLRGVREFMRGLHDAGPTRSGHPCPPVIAELPTDGTDEAVVRANAWMVKQLLAQGVHGLILCHAETPGAVRAYVEAARLSFHGPVKGLGQGRRGHGGNKLAAAVWGVSVQEYVRMADAWPLNPQGELLLGIKCENRRAAERAPESIAVPGVGFAEWGAGDMVMSFGYREKPSPLPEDLQAVRRRVVEACEKSGVPFLCIADRETLVPYIEDGARIFRVHDPDVAAMGRAHTGRTMPV